VAADQADAVSRVLVIAAHPDDVDFGSAGTVAQWVDAGLAVSYCLVTNGEAGGSDRSVSRADMVVIRQAEQTAAAKQVGVHDLHFLGYPDGQVEPSLALRRDLARIIRLLRPHRVVCPSAERNYARLGVSHPDHRAVGSAALDAVYPDARNPFAFPELLTTEKLEPWTVHEVWIAGTAAPNHYVDITGSFGRKMAALRSHESQITDPDALEQRLRGWLGAAAAAGGLPEGRLAETFQVIQVG
jgi:LmbE family N-acetylglucosaminyl deacetylase